MTCNSFEESHLFIHFLKFFYLNIFVGQSIIKQFMSYKMYFRKGFIVSSQLFMHKTVNSR